MSGRGESLGTVKMLDVASWRKLRARLRGNRGGLGLSVVRRPNTRVQRTRSSASPHRSPLTRYPLGPPGTVWLLASAILCTLVARGTCVAERTAVECTALGRAWHSYRSSPGPQNAKRVYQLLPPEQPPGEVHCGDRLFEELRGVASVAEAKNSEWRQVGSGNCVPFLFACRCRFRRGSSLAAG